MQQKMIITLPWPPSVNSYWRMFGPRMIVSKPGRQYRQIVRGLIMAGKKTHFETQRLSVKIQAHPPDKRRRDLDNLFKAPLDSLQAAGVYRDDSQIDDLQISRGCQQKQGSLIVTIENANE